jgi:hypothetical protein
MQDTSNGFVLRRWMNGTVIVGSYHDVLGSVFWEIYIEAEADGVAHYGLTLEIDRAHRFAVDAVDIFGTMGRVLTDNARLDRGSDFVAMTMPFDLSPEAFAKRVATTVWFEIRTVATPLFLRRFEGQIDRSSEWTRSLAHASLPSISGAHRRRIK